MNNLISMGFDFHTSATLRDVKFETEITSEELTGTDSPQA